MKLLSVDSDAKTTKGRKGGYLTGILYLAPKNEAGTKDLCPWASEGCTKACLYTAGRAQVFPAIKAARIRKTHWMIADRRGFLAQLDKDIRALARKAYREGMLPAIRLDGTSDIQLAERFSRKYPSIQFYDYTARPRPWQRITSNYHLTFSRKENNKNDCLNALANGINVAVVFRGGLPSEYMGHPVIDGDLSDLRFLDQSPVIVGLKEKGEAKRDETGFVVDTSNQEREVA
jgi:hypothetical protein